MQPVRPSFGIPSLGTFSFGTPSVPRPRFALPPMATSSKFAGAKFAGALTPGQTPGDGFLNICTWNVGMPTATSFVRTSAKKPARSKEKISEVADRVHEIMGVCQVALLNEVHSSHQGGLDTYLSLLSGDIRMLGFTQGDVLVWRLL